MEHGVMLQLTIPTTVMHLHKALRVARFIQASLSAAAVRAYQ